MTWISIDLRKPRHKDMEPGVLTEGFLFRENAGKTP